LKNNQAVADSGKWQVTPWMKNGIEGEGGCDEDHGHDDDHEGQGVKVIKLLIFAIDALTCLSVKRSSKL